MFDESNTDITVCATRLRTAVQLLREVIIHPEFLKGNTFTDFIPVNMPDWKPEIDEDMLHRSLLSAALYSEKAGKRAMVAGNSEEIPSVWNSLGDWEIGKR